MMLLKANTREWGVKKDEEEREEEEQEGGKGDLAQDASRLQTTHAGLLKRPK